MPTRERPVEYLAGTTAAGSPPSDAHELATVFGASSIPLRPGIVVRPAGGACGVGTLCALLQKRQPKVSHHLGILRAAGLVEARRESKRVIYRLSHPAGADGITI